MQATHDLMPLEFKKYDFEEYIHPLQIGHQDLIIKKEEWYKNMDIKDLKVKSLTNEDIYKTWDNNEKMNIQSIDFINMIGVDNKFFTKQINRWQKEDKTYYKEELKQQTPAQPDSNEISLDF